MTHNLNFTSQIVRVARNAVSLVTRTTMSGLASWEKMMIKQVFRHGGDLFVDHPAGRVAPGLEVPAFRVIRRHADAHDDFSAYRYLDEWGMLGV